MDCIHRRRPSLVLFWHLQMRTLTKTFAVVLISLILHGLPLPANAQDGALHVLSVRRAEPPDCERIVIESDGESGKAYEVFFKDDVLARFAR